MQLLSRNKFKDKVFSRDNNCCVICNEPAKDAHHILDRSLYGNGGYYLNNGASVCAKHHLECEYTIISPDDLYNILNIKNKVFPLHFNLDESYDKWGNVMLPNGTRLKGELFYNDNVQVALKRGNVLDLFTKYIKYPRTLHLPWSKGLSDDDIKMVDVAQFKGKRIVVTEKLDGENTTLYNDHIHARSVDSKNHDSRNWVKSWHANIKYDIPEDMRISGENMYATHSIHYDNLRSYFYGFSIWQDSVCLSWKDTLEWFELLDIKSPEIFYQGIFDEEILKDLADNLEETNCEGYVIRLVDEFQYINFKTSVAKFVRENHVQTSSHWMSQSIVPNKLK